MEIDLQQLLSRQGEAFLIGIFTPEHPQLSLALVRCPRDLQNFGSE